MWTTSGRTLAIALSSLLTISCGSIKATFKKLSSDSSPSIFLAFDQPSLTLNEGSGALVSLTLSDKRPVPTTVMITLTSSRGDAAVDFQPVPSTHTIPANSLSTPITLSVNADSIYEGPEDFELKVEAVERDVVAGPAVLNLIVTDTPPVVTFLTTSQSAPESGGPATVSITQNIQSNFPTLIPYTVSGTATNAGVDYTLNSGTFTIPAGSTSHTFTFPIINDTIHEGTETVIIALGTPTHATLGALPTHTINILDDDPVPTVNFAVASQAVNEGVGSVTVSATLSAASGMNVTVPFTVSGTAGAADHNAVNGSITIPSGSLSGTYVFNVTDDSVHEGNETVIFTMGSPTNATAGSTTVHTVTINDNEGVPSVDFTTASQTVTESVGTVSVSVSMSGTSSSNVLVPYTVTGTTDAGDHDAVDGTFTILAGQQTATTTFNVTNDSSFESTETVIFTLGTPTGAAVGTTNVHTVSINDDDASTSISISDATVTEGTGLGTTHAVFTVTLSVATGTPTEVDYTTSANTATGGGVDYDDTSGTLTIAPGDTTGTITIPVRQDSLHENDETFWVTLSNPVNATISDNQGVGTIVDDDAPPSVNFTSATQSVNENVGTVTLTAELSTASGLAVTVPFTVSGTATGSGTDHDAANGTITIAAGATSGTYTFNVIDDAIAESNETVIFTMGAPTNASAGGTNVQTVTINDNEGNPVIEFSTASQTVSESVSAVTITATLDTLSGSSVTAPFTVSGTATGAGTDHDLNSGTITVPAGQLSGTVVFNVIDDSLHELTETVILTIGTPSGANAGTTNVHTVSITDNDTAPSISISDATITEGTGAGTTDATFTVSLNTISGVDVTVDYTTTANTATGGGVDYDDTSGTLTIAAGATTGTITVPVRQDSLDEDNETFYVDLSNPVQSTIADARGVGTIVDDDAPPSVEFSTASQSVNEGSGSVTVTAQLSAASGLAVTVPFTVGGTATGAGTDHDAADGTITIAAGATSGTYTFNVIDDAVFESTETIVFTIGSPTNATVGSTNVHTVSVIDNEGTPTVNFSLASQTVSEGAGAVTVGVTMNATSGSVVTIPFVVSGTSTSPADHDLVDGTITIAAGQTTGSVTFNLVDDTLYEATETAILTMGTPTGANAGATNVHTVSITDNDTAPSISISDVTVTEGTGAGTTPATFTVTLSAASGTEARIDYATSPATATGGGVDYDNTSGTLTIAAGATTGTVTVPVKQDSLDEANETFEVNLSNPIGVTIADAQGIGTINDDDAPPSVEFTVASQTVGEGVGTVTVGVQLSTASGLPVTVPFTITGTATGAGTDHDAADGSISLVAGATSGTYTFTVVDDSLSEPNETVVFTMGSPTNATVGATNVHTVTITDNEGLPTVNFAVASQNVTEAVGTVTVGVTMNMSSATDVIVPYTVSGTAGAADHDLIAGNITILAGQTTSSTTFNVTNDSLHETTETVILTMGAPTGASSGATNTHTVNISDDDAAPSISISDATVVEGTGGGTTDATFTISLSAVSGVDVTVDYATSANTATGGGVDYTNTSGTLTIAAGATTGTVIVPIIRDALDENDETFYLNLTNPVAATIVDSQGLGTIQDDDAPPTVSFTAASQTVSEGSGAVTVTAELSAASGLTVTIPFTVSGTATGSGTDHDAADGTITIAAGSTSGTYTFNVIDDALAETNETVIFTIGSPTNATVGATGVHTVTINDDESSPTVNFASASQTVNESVGTVTVGVTVSPVSASVITVPFTVSGTSDSSDHDLVSGTITIAAGQSSGSTTFNVTDDSLYELSETVILTIGTPTGANAGATIVHTVTINDNDTAPSISIGDATVVEGTGGGTTDATFTVTLSAVSGTATTIDYSTQPNTATGGGTDYNNASGTLTIPAGSTTGTILVAVKQDALHENDETFWVEISNPVSGTIADSQGVGTITDDDAAPTVNFSAASQTVGETVGTVTITAELSAVSGLAATIPFTVSGTATGSGTDHDAASGTITIAAGSTSGTYTFNVIDDALAETNETVIFTIGSPTNATVGATGVHTVTINDDEGTPLVSFASASQTVNESVGTVTVGVTVSPVSASVITVPFTVSGTSDSSDHDLVSGTITVAAGQSSSSTTFNVTDDSLYESTETAILTMGSPTGANSGAITSHTVSITDNDTAPSISISDVTVTEGTGAGTTDATFTVTLSAISGLPATVDYATAANTATGGGTDYNNTSGTLTIAAGSTTATLTVPVQQDSLHESNETFFVNLTNPVGATIADSQGIGTITDDDAAPTVNFSAASQTVGETVGTVTVTAELSAASGLAATIPFTVSGTATGSGTDHDAASGTITIAAGSTSGTYTFNVIDDVASESDETVILTMGAPTNATLGTTTTHTVTIQDDEGSRTINFSSASQTVSEGVGTVTVQVTLSTTSASNVTVPFTVSGTTSGSDHGLSAGTITVTAGATTGTTTFTVTDDTLYEVTETVILTMGTPTGAVAGATTTHTVSITDNDTAPSISISDVTVTEGSGGGTTSATFTITLSAVSGVEAKVDYATAPNTATGGGTDYNNASGTLTIAAGATTGTITVAVIRDSLHEADETFHVNLTNPVDATISDSQGVGTITDDDAAPTVNFSSASQTVSESAGNVTITAQLSTASGLAVMVPFTVSGTATGSGTDHNAADGTITIAAGATSADYTFTINDDSLAESSETVIFTIGSPTNATAGSTTVHTVTINDNEATPTVTFAAASQTVAESVGAVTVAVSASGASSSNMTIPFTVSGTAGVSDHDLVSGTITIAAGQTTGSAVFNVTNDSLYEATETVILTMGSPSGANLGATTVHTVSITDDDAANMPSISIADVSVTEGTGGGTTDATFTINLDRASGVPTRVDYATAANTATGGGTDYNNASGTLTIAAGATTGTITIAVIRDSLDEPDETFYINLTNPIDATIADNQATGTIIDDDGPPTVNFTAASQTVSESIGSVTITAQLTATSGYDVTVPFTVSGTATGSGTDHNAANGTITIAAGATSADYTFTINDDSLAESSETVIFTIGTPGYAIAGATNVHTVTITDNEPTPTVTFTSASQTVSEGVGSVTVGVTASGASSSAMTVPFTISGTATGSGTDHDAANGTITIAAGQTTGSTTFNVVNDSLYELTETVIFTMGSPTNATAGATTVHTVSITDNDTPPSISISDVTVTEGTGGGTTNATFTVSLSAVSGTATTVAYSTTPNTALGGGTDYNDASGTLTIAAGATTGTITVAVIQDSLDEDNETFWVDLSSPTNATISDNQGIGTITDDDASPTISIANVTVGEGAGNATFTVTLSAVSGRDVTFNWATSNGTATAGSDYTASSATGVTIAAGATTSTLTVPILDDSTPCEPSETFTVALTSISNATAGTTTATGTITDNDSSALTVSDVTVVEGESAIFTVTASPTCSAAITFDWSTSNGTGTAGTNYTTSSGTATTIAANTASTTVTVPTLVAGISSSKTFNAVISNASSNSSIVDGTGVATIAAPALDLDFTSSLPGSVTFARASAGTYFDSNRILKTAAKNIPRISYDPTTGEPLGLLIEEARTNELTYSQSFTNSTWNKGNVTATANSGVAPDGSLSADLISETTANGVHYLDRTIASKNVTLPWTLSAFVKANGRSMVMLTLYQASTSHYFRARFDLAANSVLLTEASGNAVVTSGTITRLPDGWYRVTVSGTPNPSGGTASLVPSVTFLTSLYGDTYAGSTSSGLYVWGAQLEQGIYPTSYIAAGTSSNSRAADYANTVSMGWLNTSGGSVATDFDLIDFTRSSSRYIFNIGASGSGGGYDNYAFRIENSSGWKYKSISNVGGSTSAQITDSSTVTTNTKARLAGTFFQNDFRLYKNASSVGSSNSGNIPTGLSELSFGTGSVVNSSTEITALRMKKFRYYTNQLSNSSLQHLTQPETRPVLYIENATATEGGNLTFTIKLSSAIASGATVVNWTATSDTATVGTDTSGASSGTATIAANSTSTTFTIATVDDSTVESSEAFNVTLSGLPTTVIAGDIVATGTIVDATLNHDFTTAPASTGVSVPAGWTFTRSGPATYFDSTGVMKTTIGNLLLYSSDLTNTSGWTKFRTSLQPAPIASPNGDASALKMTEDSTNNVHTLEYAANGSLGLANDGVYTFSAFVKAEERTHFGIDTVNKAGVWGTAQFNLGTGTVASCSASSGYTPVCTIDPLSSGWFRVAIAFNAKTGATTPRLIMTMGSAPGTFSYTGDGTSGLYVWGPQLELNGSVSPYIATGTAVNYAPRYEYDPTTCADGSAASGNPGCTRKLLGLLRESQSTNVVFRSAEFDNATWIKTAATVAANTAETTAPDGTNTAERLLETATNAGHEVAQTINIDPSPNTFFTYSLYVKQRTSGTARHLGLEIVDGADGASCSYNLTTAAVQSCVQTGSTTNTSGKVVSVGGGWYRVSLTAKLSTDPGFDGFAITANILSSPSGSWDYSGNSSNGLYIWGAQVEASPVPTSYIATAGAAASRPAESMKADNTLPWYGSGTWTTLVDLVRLAYEPSSASTYPLIFEVYPNGNRAQNRISTWYEASSAKFGIEATVSGSSTGYALTSNSPAAGVVQKLGFVFAGSSAQAVKDGTVGTSGSISSAPSSIDSASLGGDGNANGSVNGHLRKFQFVPRVLNSTQLQNVTQ